MTKLPERNFLHEKLFDRRDDLPGHDLERLDPVDTDHPAEDGLDPHGADASTATWIVDRLEAKALAERRSDPRSDGSSPSSSHASAQRRAMR